MQLFDTAAQPAEEHRSYTTPGGTTPPGRSGSLLRSLDHGCGDRAHPTDQVACEALPRIFRASPWDRASGRHGRRKCMPSFRRGAGYNRIALLSELKAGPRLVARGTRNECFICNFGTMRGAAPLSGDMGEPTSIPAVERGAAPLPNDVGEDDCSFKSTHAEAEGDTPQSLMARRSSPMSPQPPTLCFGRRAFGWPVIRQVRCARSSSTISQAKTRQFLTLPGAARGATAPRPANNRFA